MPKVTVSAPNGGFSDQSFLAAEASGSPPDLVYMSADDLGTYAAKGALIPLTSCLHSAGISMSAFTPGARQEVTYDGAVYGLPEFTEDTSIMVNDTSVARAGLKPSAVSTTNWTSLLATTRKLAAVSGGKPSRIGFDPKVEALFPLWAKANGGASAFYIFLQRQFFLGIPRELFEAARMDGDTYWTMFWRIAVPLARPALIVSAIFQFRASWTDLLQPLIYLHSDKLYTLSLGLFQLLNQYGPSGGGSGQYQLIIAGLVISTVPMIIVFFVGQRYFVEGIVTQGSKR